MPEQLKDLRGAKQQEIDLETNDPDLKELGSGNVTGKGPRGGGLLRAGARGRA